MVARRVVKPGTVMPDPVLIEMSVVDRADLAFQLQTDLPIVEYDRAEDQADAERLPFDGHHPIDAGRRDGDLAADQEARRFPESVTRLGSARDLASPSCSRAAKLISMFHGRTDTQLPGLLPDNVLYSPPPPRTLPVPGKAPNSGWLCTGKEPAELGEVTGNW